VHLFLGGSNRKAYLFLASYNIILKSCFDGWRMVDGGMGIGLDGGGGGREGGEERGRTYV